MFSINEQSCKVASVNPRSEFHGEDHMLAADIKLQFSAMNTLLDQIDPEIRNALFVKAEANDADLADMGMDEDYLTKLRSKALPKKHKLDWVGQGYRVVIHKGFSGHEDIYLITCKLDKLAIEVNEGGTVDFELMVHAHPTSEEVGKLSDLIQQDADVTLEPPSAEELAQMEINEQREAIAKEDGEEEEEGGFDWPGGDAA